MCLSGDELFSPNSRKMVNATLEAQRQTILHYWLSGVTTAKEIHEKTLRTVQYNLKKLRETGTVEHKRGNGRPTKVTQTISRAIGQHVHKNSAISTRQLATKIEATHDTTISHVSIWEHMKKRVIKALYLSGPQCSRIDMFKCALNGLRRI